MQWAFEAAWILVFSYFIAYLETVAISNFPYYDFVGSKASNVCQSRLLFYAIYFVVSFPMFFSVIDLKPDIVGLLRVAIDALAARLFSIILICVCFLRSHCPNPRLQTMSATWFDMVCLTLLWFY
ncbi:hypothetical protein Leryth_015444 [Lithospermum erythrorhizon]|nr:hypothetical protein Leryth_015444 [Lithospermum erythrorhizon]